MAPLPRGTARRVRRLVDAGPVFDDRRRAPCGPPAGRAVRHQPHGPARLRRARRPRLAGAGDHQPRRQARPRPDPVQPDGRRPRRDARRHPGLPPARRPTRWSATPRIGLKVLAQLEKCREGFDARLARPDLRHRHDRRPGARRPWRSASRHFDAPLDRRSLLSLRDRDVPGLARPGEPDRVHGGGRLRADRPEGQGRGGLGRPDGRRPGLRDPALRPRRPGHPPVRGGHAALRARDGRDRQPLRRRPGLGREAGKGGLRRPRRPPSSSRPKPGRARVGLELDGKRIARQGYPGQARRRGRRRRHLGHLPADPRPEPGDGLGPVRRGEGGRRADRRHPGPRRAGPGRQAPVLPTPRTRRHEPDPDRIARLRTPRSWTPRP